MTKEEMQKSSHKKVQAVTTLMKQLSLEASAEQIITPEGLIKMVVYYTDTEKYPVNEPKKDDKIAEQSTIDGSPAADRKLNKEKNDK